MSRTSDPGSSSEKGSGANPIQLDTAALKALAHPLRVRIIDILSMRGALTASKLGEIVDESSGSTSYHLRQLAKHGLVREVEGKGTARERWWERAPGGFSVSARHDDSPAGREAARAINQSAIHLRNERTLRYIAGAMSESGTDLRRTWPEATFTTINVHATPTQLAEVVTAWRAFVTEHLEPLTLQNENPETSPVEIHFDAFPLIDENGDPL